MILNVSELWIYPIKSCRGIAVDSFQLDDRGPEHDRRWMLVDERNRFLTQREYPRMALIDVALDDGALHVDAPGMKPFAVPPANGEVDSKCVLWRDTVALRHVADAADRWFSEFLGSACRLMHMPAASERVVDRDYVPEQRLVSLADAFPLLLIGEGSLELLNEKLQERDQQAVPMRRFRPNIVVAGTEPHAEDEWRRIRIGDVACSVVKPCARCAITTVDIATGTAGVEPLRTLGTYRKVGSKVLFGQNVLHEQAGIIARRQPLAVLA